MLGGVITKYKSNLQSLPKKRSNLIEISLFEVKICYFVIFNTDEQTQIHYSEIAFGDVQ